MTKFTLLKFKSCKKIRKLQKITKAKRPPPNWSELYIFKAMKDEEGATVYRIVEDPNELTPDKSWKLVWGYPRPPTPHPDVSVEEIIRKAKYRFAQRTVEQK